MVRIAALLAAVCLSGCGGWHRANTTEAQFYQDRFECESKSASMYPPLMTTSGGYQAPAQTVCNRYGIQMSCTSQPGAYTPGVTTDQNAIPRAGAFDSCLLGKGYEWRTK